MRLTATDAAGLTAYNDSTLTWDTTPPTLTISTLADGAYTNNATLNVSGSATDAGSDIKAVTVNGQQVTVTGSGIFSTAVSLVSGATTITVVATDNAGNKTTETRSITHDLTAPTLILTAPPDNSAVALSPITVTGNVNESATVAIKVNNSAPHVATVNGADFTTSVNLAVGLNTIELTATGLAGNTSSVTRTVTYDSTNPTLAVTVPAQDITTNKSTLSLLGTVSDTLSTTVMVSITMDGQTFTPTVITGAFQQQLAFPTLKQYAIVVTATDLAGNRSTVQRNVILDGLPGDINGDKTVNVFDALLTLQYAVGLISHSPEIDAKYLATADVAPLDASGKPKGDCVVNVFDALAILRHAVVLDGW